MDKTHIAYGEEEDSFPVERNSAMQIPNLVRRFARVDSEGRITLPRDMMEAMELKEEDVVDARILGSGKAKKMIISKHRAGTNGSSVS